MLKGALIGVGVAIAGLLIPIVHFVSGPFGPAIGGYIGIQAIEDPTETKAMGLGLLMGLIMAGIGFIPVGILVALSVIDSFWLVAPLAVGVYAAGLGMIGAFLGIRAARRSEG